MTTQIAIEQLVRESFEWQEGWFYELTGDAESTALRNEAT